MIPKIRVFAKAGTPYFGVRGTTEKDTMHTQVAYLDYYDEEVTVWGCGNENCGMCDDTYKLKDVELMQFTGMKDNKGADIYEGDILYFEPYETHSNDRIVEYIDGTYRGRLIRNGYSELLAECIYETKVIGNIWENPELLEVAE